MKYIIVGTAGHVDHGKSSLIKALNGFWGDGTDEEKRRGITIDLSFSYLKSGDTTLAFIDVPGHESLVSTMISGAYGFDVALVAIDINEGIMPQTKEHLEVLNFLGVKNIVIALTKFDLTDNESLAFKQEQILTSLKEYKSLHVKAICQTSIHDKASIENLKDTLFSLTQTQTYEDSIFRYYIDRVFSLRGLGTIVTGTIHEGAVEKGQKIWISELEKSAQVKNIQVHENNTDAALTHQRAALSLNIDHKILKKGMLLTQKGYLRGFKQIDIYFTCSDKNSLKHGVEVSAHFGSLKIQGKILHVESQEELQEGFCTFISTKPIFVKFQDKCIISLKGKVVAGAKVINPIYEPIKKREKLPLLRTLKEGNLQKAFFLLASFHKRGFGLVSSYQRFGLKHKEALHIAQNIQDIFVDQEALTLYPLSALETIKCMVIDIYKKNKYALISATSLSQKHLWVSQILANKILQELVEEAFLLPVDGVFIKTGVDKNELADRVKTSVYAIIQKGKAAPLAPYNIYDQLDIDKKVGNNALKELTYSKKVVRLAHNLFVDTNTLSKVMEDFRRIIQQQGFIDVQSAKKEYALSRKYLIAYLEYLDKFNDIQKEGIKRVFTTKTQ